RFRTDLFLAGRFDYLGMSDIVGGRGFETLWDASQAGGTQTHFGADEETTVAALPAHLDRPKPSERSLLLYLPIAGHHPYEWPGVPRAATPLERYLADLTRGDRALG